MLFSDMGGIDIEEVAETAPRPRRARPLLDDPRRGAGLPRQGGDRADRRHRPPAARALTPILSRLARLFVEYDMTLAEINPLGELEDGTFVALDAHMDMENEAPPAPEGAAEGARRRRRGDARGARADAVRDRGRAGRRGGPPRRRRQRHRVRRQPRPRDRRRRRLADALRRRAQATAASPPTTARSAATRRVAKAGEPRQARARRSRASTRSP